MLVERTARSLASILDFSSRHFLDLDEKEVVEMLIVQEGRLLSWLRRIMPIHTFFATKFRYLISSKDRYSYDPVEETCLPVPVK